MPLLQKTSEAEQDFIDIWLYTADTWGETQANKYLHIIETCFKKIQEGRMTLKHINEHIYCVRCQHHYIFLLVEEKPIIIAVLHKKMDLLTRLRKRLPD